MEYVVGCTLTIGLVVNNTKTLVALESRQRVLLVISSTTILHSSLSSSRDVVTIEVTEVEQTELVLSMTIGIVDNALCVGSYILTIVTEDRTTSLTVSPVVVVEGQELSVVQTILQQDVRELRLVA